MMSSLTTCINECTYISQAGTDRTGEVSGAYYVRYLNMTFNDALYIDNHVQDKCVCPHTCNMVEPL